MRFFMEALDFMHFFIEALDFIKVRAFPFFGAGQTWDLFFTDFIIFFGMMSVRSKIVSEHECV